MNKDHCIYLPNGEVKYLFDLDGEDERYVSGFSSAELKTTEGAVKIARLTLRDSLHYWDKKNRDLGTVPIDRFLLNRTYPNPAPNVPDQFAHRFPLNELRSEIIEEEVVNVVALKTATPAEMKALFDHCANNKIEIPNALDVFMMDIARVPTELVDSEKGKQRDKALFWAVANVHDLTGLPVAQGDKWLGRGGIGCSVEAVYEAMKVDLGSHVRLKPGTIKKAYERVNRGSSTLDN